MRQSYCRLDLACYVQVYYKLYFVLFSFSQQENEPRLRTERVGGWTQPLSLGNLHKMFGQTDGFKRQRRKKR